MTEALLSALGGLGLFLFGMRTMTEGLRNLAGDRLHRWIGRATRTPLSGAATGAVTTAVIQSSSATTVTAVGFVGAGLLTYEQSLGVIFGANIGTTITGWIVAVLGFKVKLGTLSLLLIFAGALLMLLGKGGWRESGRALAGFALLFLGLDFLKEGLAGTSDLISLEQFSSQSIGGRFVLLLVGLVLTVVTQSSSATVATTLAALGSGILDLPQALAVVIGADVGTTATAWLATLGGSTASRRTGLSHVIYNLLTGLMAFLLLPVYYWLITKFSPDLEHTNASLATVGFHSAFNVIGVLAILPFTRQFANLMRRIIPERSPSPAADLDPRLLQTPVAAIETLRTASSATSRLAVQALLASLRTPPEPTSTDHLDFLQKANSACRDFTGPLASASHRPEMQDRLSALLHLADHVERLLDRCRDHERIEHIATVPALAEEAAELRTACERLLRWLDSPADSPDPATTIQDLADQFESDRKQVRREFIEAAAEGLRSPDDLDRDLDARRWLRRCTWHLARISSYLEEVGNGPRRES